MDKTCATCIENDDGLCDRKGTLVHDEIPVISTRNHGRMPC